MKFEDPYIVVELDANEVPFLSCSFEFADCIVRANINGDECDVFLLTRDGWKISGVLHSQGIELDPKELRQAIVTHPKLRLLALLEG